MRKKITPNPNFFYTSTKYKFHVFNRLSDTEEKKLHVRKIQKYNEYCTFNCTVKSEFTFCHCVLLCFCEIFHLNMFWMNRLWRGSDAKRKWYSSFTQKEYFSSSILYLSSYILSCESQPANGSKGPRENVKGQEKQ